MPRSRICGTTKLSPDAAANAGFKAQILAKRLWGMMRCCMPCFFYLLLYFYLFLSLIFGLPVVTKFYQIAVAKLKNVEFLKIIQYF
jgi:hypothetical protein